MIFINFTWWWCWQFCCLSVNIVCSFSSLFLSSIIMISCYILCIRFFLKRKELSNARVVSINKSEYGFEVHFLLFIKIYKVLKINIWWMIRCNLFKFSFARNFHNKIVCQIYPNIFWNIEKRLCDKNKKNI